VQKVSVLFLSVLLLTPFISCESQTGPQKPVSSNARGIFLHHSTGDYVWNGGVPAAMDVRNDQLGTNYVIEERNYPDNPWPWENYPSDYYRLWIGGEGSTTDPDIHNLETLCSQYTLIIWKHCYPVTNIGPDSGSTDPSSSYKSLANYKAAYTALKQKMRSFPNNRFIVWSGAVEQQSNCSPEQAQRLKAFHDWIIGTWDEKGDNIYVFDFWQLETGGGLYLLASNAENAGDDHPNAAFCTATAPKFAERMCDVLQGRGDLDTLTGY